MGIRNSLLAAGVIGAIVTFGAVRAQASDVSNIRERMASLKTSMKDLERKVDSNAKAIAALPKEAPPAWLREMLTKIRHEQKEQSARLERLSAKVATLQR